MNRIEKQKEFVDRVCALVPALTDSELDRLLWLCLGADLMVNRRAQAMKGGDGNAATET